MKKSRIERRRKRSREGVREHERQRHDRPNSFLLQAHWFDMSAFWPAAEKVVKPRGTVAIWTHASLYCREWTLRNCMRDIYHTENIDGVHKTPQLQMQRRFSASYPISKT